MRTRLVMMLGLVLASGMAMAQQEGPPPPRDNQRRGQQDRGDGQGQRPPRPEDDQQGPPEDRQGGGPRAGGPRPSVPVGEVASAPVRAMMGYLALVQQYKEMAQEPTAAGVAAVVTAGDVLRARGPEAACEYFEKILPQVKNPSIRNAVHLQLADFYRVSGKADKALEHLSALMTQDVPAK